MTIRAGFIALLVVLAGLAGVRVLAPAEVSYPATAPIPAAHVGHQPGVTGRTAAAPLIVQGRIRVFASKRLVRADAPVKLHTTRTPVWSYRRWPQQLTGVVAVGMTVISRWSDGKLVAIDGTTGRIAWRASGPAGGTYTGARTGAATVWRPPGLTTSGDLVVAAGGGRVVGLDAATGARRWAVAAAGDCFTTGGGRVVCGRTVLDAPSGSLVSGWPPGPYVPVGCAVATSGCAGVRDASGHGWLTGALVPQRSAALDQPGTTVAAGLIVGSADGEVVARAPRTGTPVWRWPGAATVLGDGPGRIYVLTADRDLVALDAASGAARSYGRMAVGTEKTTWSPGAWQVAGGYLAIERIADPDPSSVHHLFTVENELIVGL